MKLPTVILDQEGLHVQSLSVSKLTFRELTELQLHYISCTAVTLPRADWALRTCHRDVRHAVWEGGRAIATGHSRWLPSAAPPAWPSPRPAPSRRGWLRPSARRGSGSAPPPHSARGFSAASPHKAVAETSWGEKKRRITLMGCLFL